ncbi:hypothetical protein [Archangium primigenium]|uniref:hypothetical protein n=1 Tax=[Archangium] primigenium TaxID=2792470 RepID=UPI00195A9C16|nr:hypothetical protein [Archangium primigenium]MBM7116395.1 hypothetical protein [Archangium primigenium]
METVLGVPFNPLAVAMVGLMALMLGALIAFSLRERLREEDWRSALEVLATELNLHTAPGTRDAFVGEVRGEWLWVGFKIERKGSRHQKSVPTLRLDVGAELPRGFVIAPRSWNDALVSGLLEGIFTAEDPVLDKRFVFQCADVPRAQALVLHPAVREPLSRLGGGAAMACVEKNQVCLSFTRDVLPSDVLHAHLESLRAVASALRVALAEAPPEKSARAGG